MTTKFESSVFINCPFDDEYAPLLEATIFCCVYFGFHPHMANIRVETGENRLDKIIGLLKQSKYSIHDLSRSKARLEDEDFRMNMPFEFGLDMGLRHGGSKLRKTKKFLVFEQNKYDLKRAMSDLAGQDPEHHNGNFETIITKVRHFFTVEAKIAKVGPEKIKNDCATYQAWLTEKKITEGHSEIDALNLPTQERIDEMHIWIDQGKPANFG